MRTGNVFPSASADLPDSASSVDSYLARAEARYPELTPGTEKTVFWAGNPGVATQTAVVYMHGFSATRQETAPLSRIVARGLGANLFCTRFAGHGMSGEALAAATVDDWLRDGVDALRIGATIGGRVVVIATSTGASIAMALSIVASAVQPEAYVLMSPNLGPRAKGVGIALLPFGEQIMRRIVGPRRSWRPKSELEGLYWTTEYPIGAVVPMMQTVRLARRAGLAELSAPAMVIYSPEDTVVDPRRIERAIARVGSASIQSWRITEPESHSKHVHAGAIQAPNSTEGVAERILRFLDGVLQTDVPDTDY